MNYKEILENRFERKMRMMCNGKRTGHGKRAETSRGLAVLCAIALMIFGLAGCAKGLAPNGTDAGGASSAVSDAAASSAANNATGDAATSNAAAANAAAASSANFTVADTGFFGVSIAYLNEAEMFTSRDKEIGYDDSAVTRITLADNASLCSGSNVSINDNTVTISKEGTYLISGALRNGMVIVNAGDADKIQLVLDGADIHSNSGAAIYVKNADKVFVTLAPNSKNSLSSGEFAAIDDNNIDGVIFAKSDLALNGSGSLTIQSPYGHGIVSKDDLKITGGVYDITAASSALSGKDSVRIADGSFVLHAAKDGIHSENAEDAAKGFIYVRGGSFTLDCGSDGMDASSTLQIDGGTFSLTVKDDAFHAEQDLIINDGNVIIKDCYEGLEGKTVTVNGGSVTLNAQDDGVNAAAPGTGTGQTTGGQPDGNAAPAAKMSLAADGQAGDNAAALTADGSLAAGGRFDAPERRSAPEDSENMEMPARRGGKDFNGNRPQKPGGGFAADSSCLILINGGILRVVANGDGIDSNGNFVVTGGEVYVSVAPNRGDSALDYDGSAIITGGVVAAAGANSMAQNFGEGSAQGSMMVTLSAQASAGETIVLSDAAGRELMSYAPEKAYNCVVLSCPGIAQGQSYAVKAVSQSLSITMDSLIKNAR